MEATKHQTNFARFTDGPLYYFKFNGIDFEPKQSYFTKVYQTFMITIIIVMLLHQIAFIMSSEATLADITADITFINYYTVGLGKILFIMYNRQALAQSHEDLRLFCPSIKLQRQYKFEHYLKIYIRVEFFLSQFFKYIFILYTAYPMVQSFFELWQDGEFTYRTPLFVVFPVPLNESVLEYVVYYFFITTSSFNVGNAILSTDLCLFSSISQMCLSLDLLSQRILELQPKDSNSVDKLKDIIQHHQKILRLAENINSIFTPSIIFSLMSSSFILCFSAYQLLDDVSLIFIIKTLILLCYEMKQVCITCYFGDKLVATSSHIFDVIYTHDWHDGSMEYRRLVLFLLTATRRPIILNVAGVTNISLITLKQVLSTSYQVFTVLKTS